jgi:hypothetical protein
MPAAALAQMFSYDAQRLVPNLSAFHGASVRLFATWCPYSCVTISFAGGASSWSSGDA